MTLNLKDPDGVAILKRLVEKADVLVENFRPDVKDRLGIGYEALSAVNPKLVYAKGHGQGQRGDDAEAGGYDGVSYWARGGIAQALKLLLIRFAQQNNRPVIRTFNDVTNTPMIAVNEKAGFRQQGRFRWARRKPIEPSKIGTE